MKREARLANLRQWDAPFGAASITHDYDFSARIPLERDDLHLFPAPEGIAQNLRLSPREPLPVSGPKQRPLHTGR